MQSFYYHLYFENCILSSKENILLFFSVQKLPYYDSWNFVNFQGFLELIAEKWMPKIKAFSLQTFTLKGNIEDVEDIVEEHSKISQLKISMSWKGNWTNKRTKKIKSTYHQRRNRAIEREECQQVTDTEKALGKMETERRILTASMLQLGSLTLKSLVI